MTRKKSEKLNARARGDDAPAAVWVERSALKPWAQNPRRNAKAVKAVADSIERFGFAAPIVARKEDGEIIAGHTRMLAAESLGLDRVPVRFVDVDAKSAHLLALADNRLGEIADWSDDLADVLSEFGLEDAELAGWDQKALDDLCSDILDDQEGCVDDIADSFAVLIECKDEAEQVRIIEACQKEGWSCRALI